MDIYIQFKLNTNKTKGINKKANLKAHIENRIFVEIKKKKRRENLNKVIKKTTYIAYTLHTYTYDIKEHQVNGYTHTHA